MSISHGLTRTLLNENLSLERTASDVGRGLRSAVGTYGFFYGGLIVDQGKREGEPVSPLHCRLPMPDDWRWVLVRGHAPSGLAGTAEQQAFERLPSMTDGQVARLRECIFSTLLPCLANKDFMGFSEGLHDYGRQAGECFAEVQGGPYRNQSIADLVDLVRRWDWPGVGQSSWGPTVFILAPSSDVAEYLVRRIRGKYSNCEVTVCRPRNEGVRLGSECHDSM
ncbi:MAG: hypothetical protein R3B96_23710 [Pirellulaceae bacterium]